MIGDSDPLVRVTVAERLEPAKLTALVADEDLRVRYVVAERGDRAALARLSDDPDPEVRGRAQARFGQHQLEPGAE
jgi:hypothetical protein